MTPKKLSFELSIDDVYKMILKQGLAEGWLKPGDKPTHFGLVFNDFKDKYDMLRLTIERAEK